VNRNCLPRHVRQKQAVGGNQCATVQPHAAPLAGAANGSGNGIRAQIKPVGDGEMEQRERVRTIDRKHSHRIAAADRYGLTTRINRGVVGDGQCVSQGIVPLAPNVTVPPPASAARRWLSSQIVTVPPARTWL